MGRRKKTEVFYPGKEGKLGLEVKHVDYNETKPRGQMKSLSTSPIREVKKSSVRTIRETSKEKKFHDQKEWNLARKGEADQLLLVKMS